MRRLNKVFMRTYSNSGAKLGCEMHSGQPGGFRNSSMCSPMYWMTRASRHCGSGAIGRRCGHARPIARLLPIRARTATQRECEYKQASSGGILSALDKSCSSALMLESRNILGSRLCGEAKRAASAAADTVSSKLFPIPESGSTAGGEHDAALAVGCGITILRPAPVLTSTWPDWAANTG